MQTMAGQDVETARSIPDLTDTRTAFAHHSDRGLRRAEWLFRVIGHPFLNAVGKALSRVALFLHLPVKGLIRSTIFGQFCGGETIEESLITAESLNKHGIGTILDHSVEGSDVESELNATEREVLRTIEAAGTHPTIIPFCVFKPTGLARTDLLEKVSAGATLTKPDQEAWGRVLARCAHLAESAAQRNVPLMIDAEESWLQNAADDIARQLMGRYNRGRTLIYNTVQLYRHDRLAFLKDETDRAAREGYRLGVKLVRGAYMEKERDRAEDRGYPSPIHATKADVDRDYDEALRFCIAHLDHISVCAGTHNERSTLLLCELMAEHGVAPDDPRIHFAQLLGMSDNISYNLVAAGYNVAKYVPYGPVREVLPYLIRRAEENTSVAGQTSRELSLIRTERRRRAKSGK